MSERDRLAKLLALARSPNAHEAESAKRAAEAMMLKHGLRAEEASGRLASGYYELPMGVRGFHQAWRFALVTAAARHCGAEAVGLWIGRKCKVKIAGVREDVDRAAALYDRLLTLVLRVGRLVEVSGEMHDDYCLRGERVCRDSFRRGTVLAIIVLLAKSSGEPLFRDDLSAFSQAPPEQSRSLATVGKSSRVWEKYQPDERSIDLDDAASSAWYEAGIETVRRWVVVGEDGELSLAERKTGWDLDSFA